MESSSLKVTRRVQRPVLEAVSLVESGRVSLICPRVFLAKINLWSKSCTMRCDRVLKCMYSHLDTTLQIKLLQD